MQKKVDLHIHSSFSDDGDYSIEEIFRFADNADLSAIAVTDHDSVDSIAPASSESASYKNIEYIPGIELTTMFPDDGSQQHILGYYVDPHSPIIRSLCTRIFNARIELARDRLKALAALGITADENSMMKQTGGLAPTATAVILSVLDNPHNRNNPLLETYIHGSDKHDRVMLFYRDFFASGKSAWVPFHSIPTYDAVQALLSTGAIPVLAHPVFTKTTAVLDIIRSYGIAGIEAYSSYHSPEQSLFYDQYAKAHSLIATAGSDFHGPTAKPHVALGGIAGNNYDIIEKMKEWRNKKSRL